MGFISTFSRSRPFRLFLLLGLIALLLGSSGCQTGLFTLMYLWKGREVDPEYNFFRKGEIKVVVVCRSLSMDQFQNETVPRDLTREISKSIKKNCKNKKLTVVDYRKVEQWLDDCNNNFEELRDVGSAFKADYVVGIELQGFRLQESPNLLQGKARWSVKTYDMKEDEQVAEKPMSLIYPPNVPIMIQDNSSIPMFRQKFVGVIALQISSLYHPHDPNKVYGVMDADLLEMH